MMNNEDFNKRLHQINLRYCEHFGYIPCITDYACSREEYLNAMETAIEEGKDISDYLVGTVYPEIDCGEV